MSDLEIFIVGTCVTILVAIAIIPLVWAAVLDGRDEEASKRLGREDLRDAGEREAVPSRPSRSGARG